MHHNNHDSKMMWWMLAGCLLLPLSFLLFGGRGIGSGFSLGWVIFIGAFVLIHILMMFSGHGHDQSDEAAQTPATPGAPVEPQAHERH